MLIARWQYQGLTAEYGDCVCSIFHHYWPRWAHKHWMSPENNNTQYLWSFRGCMTGLLASRWPQNQFLKYKKMILAKLENLESSKIQKINGPCFSIDKIHLHFFFHCDQNYESEKNILYLHVCPSDEPYLSMQFIPSICKISNSYEYFRTILNLKS